MSSDEEFDGEEEEFSSFFPLVQDPFSEEKKFKTAEECWKNAKLVHNFDLMVSLKLMYYN